MAFPLQKPMTTSTMRNDLTIYSQMVGQSLTKTIKTKTKKVRDSGPAMTWSIHAILWLQLGEHDLAEKFFNHSYQPHVTKPFGIWTENRWAFNQEYIFYIRKYIVICPYMGIDGPKNVAPEIHRKCRQPNFGAVNFLTGMGGFLQVDISICA